MTKNTFNNFHFGLRVDRYLTEQRAAGINTYKKLAVQWLNEVLFFVSSSVLADSLVLRNRQLLVAANRQTV